VLIWGRFFWGNRPLLTLTYKRPSVIRSPPRGAVAQLGECLTGSQEVAGSIPVSSTSFSPLNFAVINDLDEVLIVFPFSTRNFSAFQSFLSRLRHTGQFAK
jgi:hypothetical protein